MRNRSGFSIVELCVTTLIVSACYCGVANTYLNRRDVAENKACEVNRRQLGAALEAWNMAHGKSAGLEALPALVLEGYLTKAPRDPGSAEGTAPGYFHDGREVRCRVHPRPPAQVAKVEVPPLWVPAIMLVYGFLRFWVAFRRPRALVSRVSVPVMDPMSGPLNAPSRPVALVLCSFCTTGIAGEVVKVNGRPMHADCGAFCADELER